MRTFLYNEWTLVIFGGLLLAGIIQVIKLGYEKLIGRSNVKKANNFIIDMLEKAMINDTNLTISLLESFISTSVRKYRINSNKIYAAQDFVSDVIVRIYETDHLSAESKNKNINELLAFKSEIYNCENSHELNKFLKKYEDTNDNLNEFKKTTNLISFLLIYGMILAIFLVFLLFYMLIRPKIIYSFSFAKNLDYFIMSIYIVIILLSILILFILKIMRRKK